MAEDLGKQVELQAQLNKLLEQRLKLQNQLNEACGKQCATSNEMNAAAGEATKNQEKQVAGQDKITSAQEKARKSQEKSGKTADGFFSKITTGQAAAAGGVIGLVKGFKDMGFSLKGIGGLIKGFVTGLFSIGAAIIKLPFKIFSGLVGMANNMAQAGVALRQAFEDVRKEFGSFAEGPAKNVTAGFRDMNKAGSDLAGTGLSVEQVYGYGPDGMAAMLKDVADLAKGLGSTMNLLGDEFGKVAQKATMFKKGMGLASEQMGKLMKDAKLSGQSQTEMMTEVGSMSLQMAKKFGLSSKDIARDIADMKGDFVTFGNVSTTQMGAASAYARKLGMTMKDLKGVVDKFDNFEGAADSVSQLNQAFGIQLDTMKMMNAENPAERIDMMRESFFAAGKSIENMTRQEKKLLQQQTGLTEAAMQNAFAAENQGVAYDDFADAAADAEEQKMSEKEVMLKLAEAIEKITKVGPKFTGIFDAFFQGFGKGMAYQKDFKALLSTIFQFLRTVYDFGKKIGASFADLLGKLGILGNLQKIFDPTAAAGFFSDIMKIVDELKAWLLGGPGDPNKILQKFADKFTEFFKSKGGASKGLGEGMKRLGMIITKLFKAMAGWLWKKVSPILLWVFDKASKWLSNNWKPIAVFLAKWVIAPLLVFAFMKGLMYAAAGGIVKWLAMKFGMMTVAATAASGAGGASASAAAGTVGIAAWLKSLGAIDPVTITNAAKTLMLLAWVFTKAVVLFAAGIATAALILSKTSWSDFAKTLVGVTVGLYATFKMLIAAQTLEPLIPIMPLASKAMLLAAVVFSVGMVAYALGIAAVSAILSGIPMMGFLKQFGVIALLMAATGLVVLGAALLVSDGGMALGLALLGLLGAAVLFNVGMVAYAGGIYVVDKILKGIDMKGFLGQLGTIALCMAATAAMVVYGAPLGSAIGLAGLAFAAVGTIAAAGLFTVGMYAYVKAIGFIQKQIDKISGFDKFPEKLKVVGLAMLATVGLLGMAAFGILAAIGFPIIIAGLTAASALFEGGMMLYANAIYKVDKNFKVKKGFEKKLEIVSDVINMTAKMLKIAGKMGLTALLGFGGPSIDSGAAFFIEAGPKLFEMVKSIDGIKVPNPKKTAAVVGIVKDLIMAMSALKALVPEQGVFSSIATMLSGGSPKALVSEMGTFITSILDKIKECVTGFVYLAQGMSKSDLEKGKVVASIIKAIADVAAALAPTLKVIAEDASYTATMKLLSGGSVTHKAGAAMDGMTVFFDKLTEKLPPLIEALVAVMTKAMKGKNPKKVSAQAEILGKIMGAVKDVMQAVGSFQKMVGEQDGWLTSTKGAMKEVEKMFDMVSKLVGPGGSINKMIRAMIDLASELTKLTAIKPEDMKAQIKILTAIAGDVLPSLGEALTKMAEAEFPDISKKGFWSGKSTQGVILKAFENMATLIKQGNAKLSEVSKIDAPFDALKDAMSGLDSIVKGYDSKYFGAKGSVVKAAEGLVDSYNATYAALESMTNSPVDLQIKLQTFADAMGMDQSTFTINNEKLNFTINVNVELDAEKLSDSLTDKPTMGKKTVQLAGGT